MAHTQPVTTLDDRYSSPDAVPTDWSDALGRLENAELAWLSTVRPDGRPHVTPLLFVWLDATLYFCTGPAERKARNLSRNPHVVLTTGTNSFEPGLDLVIEGDAERVTDDALLRPVAAAYLAKYGSDWHFEVGDGGFVHPGHGRAVVYAVAPGTAFGFGKDPFSQTRWRFGGNA